MDGGEDEFLLGRRTMKEIGIDIDRLFEQLAENGRVYDVDEDDVTDTNTAPTFGDQADEVEAALLMMIEKAYVAGFNPPLLTSFGLLYSSSRTSGVFGSGLTHLPTSIQWRYG